MRKTLPANTAVSRIDGKRGIVNNEYTCNGRGRTHVKKRMIVCCLLLLLLGIASGAGAEDQATYQRAADFLIEIEEDGSAIVSERWEVEFSGEDEFSRYGRVYLPSQRYALTDWHVAVDGKPCTLLGAPDEARPEGRAAVYEDERGTVVEVYHRSENEARTIEIGYTVQDAVLLYDDVAEFAWNLTGASEVSHTGYVRASLTLPYAEGAETADYHIWAHGPLNGSLVKEDANHASLSVGDVPGEEPLDVRVAMPPDWFTGGHRMDGNGMGTILAQEARLAERANFRRHALTIRLCVLAAVAALCLCLAWILKRTGVIGRGGYATGGERVRSAWRHDAANEPEYLYALPDGCSPALVGLLCHFYDRADVSGQILTATLMELSRKGCVKIENDTDQAYLSFNKVDAELLPHEQAMRELLLWAAQDRARLSMQDVKARMEEKPEEAKKKLDAFFAPVETELKSLTERPRWNQNGFVLVGMSSVLAFLLCVGMTLLTSVEMYLSGLLLAAALFFIVLRWGAPGVRLSQEGEDVLAGWSAFGRYLDAFVLEKETALPDVNVWRQWIVYATAMGRDERLLEALPLRYPEMKAGSYDGGVNPWYSYALYSSAMNSSLHDLGDSMRTASKWQPAADASAAGSGGGFSSSGGGSGSGSGGSFSN